MTHPNLNDPKFTEGYFDRRPICTVGKLMGFVKPNNVKICQINVTKSYVIMSVTIDAIDKIPVAELMGKSGHQINKKYFVTKIVRPCLYTDLLVKQGSPRSIFDAFDPVNRTFDWNSIECIAKKHAQDELAQQWDTLVISIRNEVIELSNKLFKDPNHANRPCIKMVPNNKGLYSFTCTPILHKEAKDLEKKRLTEDVHWVRTQVYNLLQNEKHCPAWVMCE